MNFIALSSTAKLLGKIYQPDVPHDRLAASCDEAGPLERGDVPIEVRSELGGESVERREHALDRRAIGGGLRRNEAHPRQRDIEGPEPPASSPVDELARL